MSLVLSASQIDSFDPTTTWGCNRRWWFERVKKVPRGPPDKALVLGDAVHSTIEEFLKTGHQGILHEIARAGVQTLLNYRPRVKLIEHKIDLTSGYTIAGVPIVGKIDAVAFEPFELIDWKTTSSIGKYAKTKGQLKVNTQLNIYADYLLEHFSELELDGMLFSHGYFGTKKREHDLVSVMQSKREIKSCILTTEETVSKMVTVAAVTDLEKVAPNENVCNIGFGCPHRAYCPRSGSFNLASLLDVWKVPAAPVETAPAPVAPPADVKVEAQGVLPPDAAPRTTPVAPPAPATPSAESNPAQPDGQITAQVGPPPAALAQPEKKRAGRPPGSKNKPKDFAPPPPPDVNPAPAPVEAKEAVSSFPAPAAPSPVADLSKPAPAAILPAEVIQTKDAGAGTSIKIERITLRHGAKVGMPDFSSVLIEAEYTALVTGNVEKAREELSTYVKGAMIKELDLYVKKSEEMLKKKAEQQANNPK